MSKPKKLKSSTLTALLAENDFYHLFIDEMGWVNPNPDMRQFTIAVADKQSGEKQNVDINTIAQSNRNGGLHIFTCALSEMPTQSGCHLYDKQLREHSHHYLIIFYNPHKQHHCWLCPVKKNEKREMVLVEYNEISDSKTQFLLEKLNRICFANDEEPTIVDVCERVYGAFAVNSEKITKSFYSEFRKQHTAFATFITGINNEKDRHWYTSVMLNRLMFCYFIQKKGFLNRDPDYLGNKLREVKNQEGDNQFYSFYRSFLCSLFHNGLNSPRHTLEWEQRFGRIPYLNGGMFDTHQLETQYRDINIPDEAFEGLFKFFDTWQWHLDTRITASGKDINPDVLGYIFEQYINDRSAMGAYYTKEDITEYISKNCILPFLFDRVAESLPQQFRPNGYVWQTLRESGMRYIYPAVQKGYSPDWQERLPDHIRQGLSTTKPDLLGRRSQWNSPTDEAFALPTEIWRETIARLQRCTEVQHKITQGEITHINDFITYNLNIRAFAYDLLEGGDHHFVSKFYETLKSVTILDPPVAQEPSSVPPWAY